MPAGSGKLVDRPEVGAIVECDPRAIAAAVRKILAGPPDRHAVRSAVERFSWERNSETLFAHLSAFVQRQQRGDNPALLATEQSPAVCSGTAVHNLDADIACLHRRHEDGRRTVQAGSGTQQKKFG